MKKLLFLLLLLLLPAWAGAQPSSPGFLSATESDGSPDCYGWQLKFGNGTVTDNNDGTCSVSSGSGSGTVNSGLAGFFTYYPSDGTTVDDQSVFYTDGTNIGIGTTVPLKKFSICSSNAAGTTPQCGYLESKDYGGGVANNNIVLGASTLGAPNIRLQVDNVAAHVGFNIGGTTNSAATIQLDGSLNGYLGIRGANHQSNSDTTEVATLTMGTSGLNINTGKGNIFLTPFAGNVGIGTTNPIGAFEVAGSGATKVHAFSVYSNTATDEPLFYFRRGRGSLTSPAVPQAGDILGSIRFAGQQTSAGANFSTVAKMEGEARGTYDGNSNPAAIHFYTTPSGSAVPVKIMTIASDGNVGINTSVPLGQLEVRNASFPVLQSIRTSTSTNAANTAFNIQHSTTSDMVDGFGIIQVFSILDSANVRNSIAHIQAQRNGADNSGDLGIFTYASGSATDRLHVTSSGNVGISTTVPLAPLSVTGHFHSHGTAPTVASNDCGTTTQGTVVAKSTDVSGSFTVGTLAVTACAVTFNGTWTNAPNCVATDDSNIIAVKAVATTTKLTVSSVASMSGDVISYICVGNE